MIHPNSNLQYTFLEKVRSRFAKKSDFANTLMELLQINRDGAYRRIRGETALSASDLEVLAAKFDISIDELLSGEQDKILFSYNLFERPISRFNDYLEQVYKQVVHFSQIKGMRVYYSSREIPVFFFMKFPRLLSFKLYLYGLTAWYFEELQDQPFRFGLLEDQEVEMAQAISQIYCTIDSTDIWPLSLMEQTLNQIEYMAMEGRISSLNDALLICEDVEKLLMHCKKMAEKGVKFMPNQEPEKNAGKFDLFYNEIISPDNNILCISDNQKALFNIFTSPNFLYTTDERLCHKMEDWLEETLSHSTPISVYARRSRNIYFNYLSKRIQSTRTQIEQFFQNEVV